MVFGNWTNEMWQTSTANKHSGNYAAVANDTSNNIYGKDLNTGSYNKMTVSFWCIAMKVSMLMTACISCFTTVQRGSMW